MSFGGHVSAAIKSLEENRKLRSKKSFFKQKELWQGTGHTGQFEIKKASPVVVAENRKRQEKYIADEKKKNVFYLFLSVCITFSIFYFLFFDEAFSDFIYRFLSGW